MDLDELKKQKALESLSSDVDTEDSSTARTIGRLAAGATPTLFALLSDIKGRGASASILARGIGETEAKYAAGKPSKLVPIVGPDGTPIYETPEGALGEKVYQKPTAQAGTQGKWLPGKTWVKDSSGNEELVDTLTNNASGAIVNAYTKEPVIASRSYVKPTTSFKEDIGGSIQFLEGDITKKGDGKIKSTLALSGIAPHYGVSTKNQAESIERGFEAGQKAYQDLYEKEQNIADTVASLKTNKDPRVLSQDIYGLARAAEAKDRLTQQDFQELTGVDKETWFNKVKYAIDTGAFGDIEDLSRSFVPLAERVLSRTRRQMSQIPSKFAPQTQPAQKGLKSVLPLQDGSQKSIKYTREQLEAMTPEQRAKIKEELLRAR